MIECHDSSCNRHLKTEPFCGEEKCVKYNENKVPIMDYEGLFIEEFIKDDAYYHDLHPTLHLGEIESTDVEDAVISFYCNCLDTGGQDDTVLFFLHKYLYAVNYRQWPEEYEAQWYIVMNIFETNKLVESGVSIRVPWLTNRGMKALHDMGMILTSHSESKDD